MKCKLCDEALIRTIEDARVIIVLEMFRQGKRPHEWPQADVDAAAYDLLRKIVS